MRIPPQSSAITTAELDDRSVKGSFLFQPVELDNFSELQLEESFIQLKGNGQATIVLTNPSGSTCKLPQGTCVGVLTEAEAMDTASFSTENKISHNTDTLKIKPNLLLEWSVHLALRIVRGSCRKLLLRLVFVYHCNIKLNCFHFCMISTMYLHWMREREVRQASSRCTLTLEMQPPNAKLLDIHHLLRDKKLPSNYK